MAQTNFITTPLTLSAATSALLVSQKSNRNYLLLQNTGTNPASFTFGSGNAVAGAGISLDPASAAGGQGGSIVFDSQFGTVPQDAVHAISTAGTTVVAVEG